VNQASAQRLAKNQVAIRCCTAPATSRALTF
jgi:hypothetical protein